MEWLENNILKEKLEQLDTLPEGYSPSLESKFELLMAAAPAPAKRSLRIYYLIPAAAAAVVVVFLYLSGAPQQMQYAAEYYRGHEVVQPAATTPPVLKTETIAHIQKTQYARKRHTIKKTVPADVITQTAPQHVALVTPVVTEQTITSAVSDNTQKKEKKVRYTEIDFDDEPVTVATTERSNTSKHRVAFRFSIFNTTAGTTSKTSPVQLKQNF